MANVSFRSDPETDQALRYLTADGTKTSEAVRTAVLEQARRLRRERLMADGMRVSTDAADLAEMANVKADMDPISAW